VHLDVPAAPEDLDAAVDRLVSTGATLVDHGTQGDHRWAVMQDPEGNEFCLQ
jgi:predicted enzyme related to lactoylglutathione lyase